MALHRRQAEYCERDISRLPCSAPLCTVHAELTNYSVHRCTDVFTMLMSCFLIAARRTVLSRIPFATRGRTDCLHVTGRIKERLDASVVVGRLLLSSGIRVWTCKSYRRVYACIPEKGYLRVLYSSETSRRRKYVLQVWEDWARVCVCLTVAS